MIAAELKHGRKATRRPTVSAGRRPRLVAAFTFPVHPPLGGGQVRAFHLYRELARVFDVELITLAPADARAQRMQLAPGLWENRVPKSARHAAEEARIQRECGTLVTDIAMTRLYRQSPEYLRVLRDAAQGAHAVIASHPYTFPAIREVTSGPIWYEAQDVEAILKASVLTGSDAARGLLADVEQVERTCCREAELVWACSVEDRDELISRYGAPADRVVVVPNGVALENFSYASSSVRRDRKRSLGMDGRFLALFIGSWHQPNVVGVGKLLQLAAVHRTTEFVVVGSIDMAFAGRRVPDNVDLTGVVSSEFKAAALGIVDVALNPVTSGSGTNIKMLDYFASGVPVISTRFGARGLGVRAGEHYLGVELDQFAGALTMARETDAGALDALAQAARAHIERTLTWSAVAESLLAVLC